MKQYIFLIASILILASCSTQKPLYTWGKYDVASYKYLKNRDDKSTQELIKTYKSIIAKQRGTRKVVPPGVYADYGYILLQENKIKEGKAMLLKEVSLYPESKPFIKRILKMLDK